MSTRSAIQASALAATRIVNDDVISEIWSPNVLRPHTNWVADLEHWHFVTFLARWRDPVMGETLVRFLVTANGTIGGVEIEGLSEFERR